MCPTKICRFCTVYNVSLSSFIVFYLPMQKAKVIDNKSLTDLGLKYGPNI